MTVWRIQLKDNREIDDSGRKINKFDSDKFDFCIQHNLIGVGWKSTNKELNKAYKNAIESLEQMKEDDLVWAKHPTKSLYYLCKIIDNFVISTEGDKDFENIDISYYRRVEISKETLTSQNLPFDYRNITIYETVRAINNKYIENKTIEKAKELLCEK